MEDRRPRACVVAEKVQLDAGGRKALRVIQSAAAWCIDVTSCAEPARNLDDSVLPMERVGHAERARTNGVPTKAQTRDDLAQQPLEVIDRRSVDVLQRLENLGCGLSGIGEERYAARPLLQNR